jgi:alkylhydroperoxidase/carboxymuconolactone decarboxylase family protein YurZ
MTSTPSSPCLGIRLSDDKAARLDAKAPTLARLAALVAVGASCVCYGWAVDAALAADATVDEIVGILIPVAPITGLARVVAAATPAVARSVGHDRDGRFRHCIASCATDREGSGNQERPSQAYLASRPISCTRWTAWPRELAPSLR